MHTDLIRSVEQVLTARDDFLLASDAFEELLESVDGGSVDLAVRRQQNRGHLGVQLRCLDRRRRYQITDDLVAPDRCLTVAGESGVVIRNALEIRPEEPR